MNKKIKVFLLMLIATGVLALMLPHTSQAATLKKSADGKWGYYLEHAQATVAAYYGSGSTVKIPSKIDGAKVTSLYSTSWNSQSFRGNMGNVTNLTLPNTITELPMACFDGCKQLVSITISSKMTGISDYCFRSCTNLKTIKNYGKVTYIGCESFSGCSSLTAFDFSKIESMAGLGGQFYNCSSLKKASFSAKLQSIPKNCFYNCSSLESVTFKKGLETIGSHAFENCSSLKKVSFPSTLTRLGEFSSFDGCTKLTSVTIPKTLTYIGSYTTFTGCTGLKSVNIQSATSIPYHAFDGCTSLKKVTLSNHVKSLGFGAFANCIKLPSIVIPEITTVPSNAFENCEVLSVIYGIKGSSAETFAKDNGIPFKQLKNMSKVKISKISNKAYTGKAITPSVTIKYGSTKLKKGTDYTVSYKSNKKIGRAMMTITGKGKYLGEKVVYFNIVPPKTTVKKLESKKTGQLTVTVNKSKGAKGYVIAYSTKKSSGYKKIYTTKTKTTIKKLKSGKKYYVKVTPYTVVLAQKQSPAYSAVKSKKVKQFRKL